MKWGINRGEERGINKDNENQEKEQSNINTLQLEAMEI